MKILPPRTPLPKNPTERSHSPEPANWDGGYRAYRPCLRWDFNFSCAFCLLHEADFFRTGKSRRSGLFSAEHVKLQSQDKAGRNDYRNCVYCCRYCNRARSIHPTSRGDDLLLDPSKVAWSDHFAIQDDELQPVTNDGDAGYTCEAYQLNDPLKTEFRRARRETIQRAVYCLTESAANIKRAHTLLDNQHLDDASRSVLVQLLQDLEQHQRSARMQLESYPVVPADADKSCRCEPQPDLSVAVELIEASLDSADLTSAAAAEFSATPP